MPSLRWPPLPRPKAEMIRPSTGHSNALDACGDRAVWASGSGALAPEGTASIRNALRGRGATAAPRLASECDSTGKACTETVAFDPRGRLHATDCGFALGITTDAVLAGPPVVAATTVPAGSARSSARSPEDVSHPASNPARQQTVATPRHPISPFLPVSGAIRTHLWQARNHGHEHHGDERFLTRPLFRSDNLHQILRIAFRRHRFSHRRDQNSTRL